MIIQVFSVVDKAVSAFLPPIFARSRGEAIRSFTEAVNSEGHQFKKHALDYVLFYCGEFDDATGLFSTAEPVRVVGAFECLVDDGSFGRQASLSGGREAVGGVSQHPTGNGGYTS